MPKVLRRNRYLWLGAAGIFFVSAVAWVWQSGQHTLMTDAELEAAIPPELRPSKVSDAERKLEDSLDLLNSDLQNVTALKSQWIIGPYQAQTLDELRDFLPASADVPKRIEKICDLGGLHLVEPSQAKGMLDGNHVQPMRVLCIRLDLLIQSGRRQDIWPTAHALVRQIRLDALVKSDSRSYDSEFRWPCELGLGAVKRLLQANLLNRNQLSILENLLPSDRELVEVQRERNRLDFQHRVVDAMKSNRRERILRSPNVDAPDSSRYLSGRLNMPMTFAREADAALRYQENLGRFRTQQEKWPTRTERGEFYRGRPWPKPSDPRWLVTLRDTGYRWKLRMQPNARGWLVSLGKSEMQMEGSMRDRNTFAVLRAKIRCGWDPKALMPTDPGDGKPIRQDFKRGIVWAVGVDGVDDGGKKIAPGLMGEIDVVEEMIPVAKG